VAAAVFVVYFVVKAVVLGGSVGMFALTQAAAVAAAGIWVILRSRRSSVMIDADHFTVIRGRRSETFLRQEVAAVDLSGFARHLTMADGTGVRLPLEGRALVEAGLLLTPRPNPPKPNPPTPQ
jgi:hypothetical protein